MKTLQSAAKKFRNYAAAVECDVLNLMFELMDIIDAKTRTLRHLMELYLQIKTIEAAEFKGEECVAETNNTNSLHNLNEEELLSKSIEKMTDLIKSSLPVIKEDAESNKPKNQKHIMIPKVEKFQSEEDILERTKTFVDDLVEYAMSKSEQRRLHQFENGKTELFNVKANKMLVKNDLKIEGGNDKETDNASITSKESEIVCLSENTSEKVINSINFDGSVRSVTSNKFECATFRTIIDPKNHRMYNENNYYKQDKPQDGRSDSNLSDCTDVEVNFVTANPVSNDTEVQSQNTNPPNDEIVIKDSNLEATREKYLFPEVYSNSFGLKPRGNEPSSWMSMDRVADIQQARTKTAKKKSRSPRKMNMDAKVRLDPLTYRKVCSAILSTVNKQDIARMRIQQKPVKNETDYNSNCDLESVKTGKSSSDHEVDNILRKMMPTNVTADINKMFMNRARIVHPWKKNTIVTGRDVFKKDFAV
ncbi:unnamed protein product [Phyllotreta striolata]|uniref:Uncharacterized protein n=1 Tax=Phyllotreta striolata TaxID=444603 RepID=A0A9N9TLR7_PHYSR|nr:unnamed protein product [Phyllotreta striolata]